jgi:hypothetical protein
MMGYFLADKTITLHDLANNGLLQLDQIRSYNTSLLFSNHSSDDNPDQTKENEEYFLDELDSSSRRSLTKSSDQHSIPKRLTDTSLATAKQTSSLKSAQTSKQSSDDRQRKSSLPGNTQYDIKDNQIPLTKQQRRQTVAASTLPASSRLANQTTTKKSSKCKLNLKKMLIFIFTPFYFRILKGN